MPPPSCAAMLLAAALGLAPVTASPAPQHQPGSVPGTGEYPVPALVELSEAVAAQTYTFEPWDGGPDGAAETVDVGARVRDAFIRIVHLHLQPARPGDPAALTLELVELRSGLARGGGRWQARVDLNVVIRGGDEVLGRWPLLGVAPVGAGDGALRSAFSKAAAEAADAFVEAFDTSGPVGVWLAGQGLRQPRPPERPAVVPYLDLGVAAATVEGGLLLPLELHAGAAGLRWFAQAVASWRPDQYEVQASNGSPAGTRFEASAAVTRVGLDAGFPLRLGATWELRAGAGVHWLRADLTIPRSPTTLSKSSVGGSLVAGATWIGAKPFAGIRFRVGLEARVGLGTEIRFEALDASYQAVTSALLTVGVERTPAP